jgi:hypothetical protein
MGNTPSNPPGPPRKKAVYTGSMRAIISGGGLTAHRGMHIDHEAHAIINHAAHGGSIGSAARALGRGNCPGSHCQK